ncbi:MAG: sigma-70 family RNA polymerase sigma factor [Xanthomonadales bacterium]|nr:sigma-70 family RNA polymerase sigma factor [Xanthomonadales bacterium]
MDSRIFHQWVQAHQDRVWSLARYLLKDASEAEDAAQEAFIKLWDHRHKIDPERVGPWIMRVTRNGCLDRLRRRKPETELTDEQHSDHHGPMSDTQQSEANRWLQRAIAGLREPYRSLVVLRDLQQHSYQEVAHATELSLSQVKVYLHRARKQLREELAEVRP